MIMMVNLPTTVCFHYYDYYLSLHSKSLRLLEDVQVSSREELRRIIFCILKIQLSLLVVMMKSYSSQINIIYKGTLHGTQVSSLSGDG
jgi:hypothetical protein